MGERFGTQLRAERTARGLSQTQLGGQEYSAGYISLLETGHREPTPAVIAELAGRLRLAPQTLEAGNLGSAPEEGAFLQAGLAARQAWDARDYPESARQAAAAARRAHAAGNPAAWWEMAYLQAEALMRQGETAQAALIAQDILSAPLTGASDALTVRARQLLSALCLGLGEPAVAAAHARAAVKASAPLPAGSPLAAAALISLIAALAESGRLEEAWEQCETLAAHSTHSTPGQAAGEAEWAIGSVAFLRGDAEEGARRHERAAGLLSPANDLQLWARFNKASAAARLAGGITEPETLAALERAEIAYSIVEPNRPDQLELALVRAHWLHLDGQHELALEHLERIHRDRHLLGHRTAGQAALLHGQALTAIGRHEAALEHLRHAHAAFARSGLDGSARTAEDAIAALPLTAGESRTPTSPAPA